MSTPRKRNPIMPRMPDPKQEAQAAEARKKRQRERRRKLAVGGKACPGEDGLYCEDGATHDDCCPTCEQPLMRTCKRCGGTGRLP